MGGGAVGRVWVADGRESVHDAAQTEPHTEQGSHRAVALVTRASIINAVKVT